MRIPYFRLGQYGVIAEVVDRMAFYQRSGGNLDNCSLDAYVPDNPSAFGRLVVSHDADSDFSLLIYFAWATLPPQVLLVPEIEWILLGVENRVCAINLLTEHSLEWTVELPHKLYALLYLGTNFPVVAIHELGATGLNGAGNKEWSYDTDVVTHYSIQGSVLTLTDMETVQIKIDMKDGRPL